MQLIVMLLGTVAILTLLSGLITFFGAKKGDRVRSAWFLAAASFAFVWMTSICFFLAAGPEKVHTIDWHAKWVFVSAVLIDVAFLGYVSWKEKYGKYLTFLFLVLGLILCGFIFAKTDALYSAIILSVTGNSIVLNIGPLYISYVLFFCAVVPAIVITLIRQYLNTRSDRKRGGDLTIMVSFAISSVLIVVTEVILPVLGNWSLIWIGPLALSATIITFYYTILRYRALNLSSIWLKIFSYVVLLASLAIVYMIIFALVFAGIFRGSMPSAEVIVLNFIMVMIFLILIPAINELYVHIKSLISDQNPKHKGAN